MTIADIESTGTGKLGARLTVAGLPVIFASSQGLAGPTPDGRTALNGLRVESLKFAARADLVQGDLPEGDPMEVEIVDVGTASAGRGGAVTEVLAKRPTRTTYLVEDLSATSTAAAFVASTDGWPSAGTIHIGQEAIRYTGITPTSFTGLTRASWETIAQAHYTGDGDSIAFARVTDHPFSLEGRRVYVDLYGEGEISLGGGVRRWRGVISHDKKYQAGLWTFGVQPLSYLLSQAVGRDLEEPVPIRGIYYSWTAACRLDVARLSGAGSSTSVAEEGRTFVTGHFETEADFTAAVTTALQGILATFSGMPANSQVYAEPDPRYGWRIVYGTSTPSPVWLRIGIGPGLSPLDAPARLQDGAVSGFQWYDSTTDERVTEVVSGATYVIHVQADFPRASVGARSGIQYRDRDAAAEAPDNRVYIGGTVVPTTDMHVVFDRNEEEGEEEDDRSVDWRPVLAFDSTDRFVTLDRGQTDFATLGSRDRLELARTLVNGGTVADLRAKLISDSPTLASLRGLPLFTLDDFTSAFVWTSTVEAALGNRKLGSDRVIIAKQEVELADILYHELRLIGCYLSLDEAGKLTIRRLRLGLPTDEATATITESDIVGKGFPVVEEGAAGQIDELVIRTGYDWREDEHTGRTITIANRFGKLPNSASRKAEIAPLSIASTEGTADGLVPEVTVEDAFVLAQSILGIFGGPYRYLTVEVSLRFMGTITIGDTVLLSSPYIPGPDGILGVESQPSLVVGVAWMPGEARGELTLLSNSLRIAGYAPELPVAGQSNTSGNDWQLTTPTAGYTDRAAGAAAWFPVGALVELVERDVATRPTRVSATVTASASGTVDVTTTATWTPGASRWLLAWRSSAEINADQIGFLHMAEWSRRLTVNGAEVDAYEFSP